MPIRRTRPSAFQGAFMHGRWAFQVRRRLVVDLRQVDAVGAVSRIDSSICRGLPGVAALGPDLAGEEGLSPCAGGGQQVAGTTPFEDLPCTSAAL